MKKRTSFIHAGRHSELWHGAVNPPPYRCSTILAPSMKDLHRRDRNRFVEISYGIHGTPTSRSLEEVIAGIEGGSHCVVLESGLAAVTVAILACVQAGDHVLVPESVYGPTRSFCDDVLRRFHVETTYYDPRMGAGISALIRDRTTLIMTESPGSITFEVQDIPAIARAAHARGVLVAMDNTWGIVSFAPFEKGVDISIQAATKYIVGHSDAMLGAITVEDSALYERIRQTVALYGFVVGSEEAWLGLRGVRTLGVRLDQQFSAGKEIACWLEGRPEVAAVLHPALPSHPDHAVWQRDFSGGCGLFSIVLKEEFSSCAVEAMVDGYEYFGIGYSWGGYESLVIAFSAGFQRHANVPRTKGALIRYHVGLEAVADLMDDLERGFDRLHEASSEPAPGSA